MADLEAFRTRLEVTADRGDAFEARCPAHDDAHASLSVSVGASGGVVAHCHAGCDIRAVVAALGLTMADLNGAAHIVASYPYVDASGVVLWLQHRWAPKSFTADPGLPLPAERPLYNLPAVLEAVAHGVTVRIVEGEKDVETLRAIGVVATCNVNGAGKWLAHYSSWLEGADLIIIADNDETGIAHARTVYRSVSARAKSVTIQRPLYGKDITDLLEAGYGLDHTEPVSLNREDMGGLNAKTIRATTIQWIWEGYIPRGGITLIDGDPGEGKSTLVCDLVARWTSGLAMPDDSDASDRIGVVMITAEDDPGATIRPRLEAAGADLSQVLILTDESDDDDIFLLSASKLGQLEAYLVAHRNIGVVTIDPLSAFWPPGTNSYVDAEVRAALRPLAGLARRCGVAVLLVRHLTKSASKALYAGSGSIGIIGAARAAFMVKADPMDATRRVFVSLKANLAVRPTALGFTLASSSGSPVARVDWLGPVQVDAEMAFTGRESEPTATEAAGSWLRDALTDTWLTWREIEAMGKAQGGWSKSTLRRARDAGSFRSVRNPAIGGLVSVGTYWIREDQWPFDEAKPTDSSQDAHLLIDTNMGNDEQVGKSVTESEIGPDGGPLDFESRPRVCDVCGLANDDESPVHLYASPWWAIRCRAHNPRRYRP